MAVKQRFINAVGAVGLALHAALRPNQSQLEAPQAQTVPDRDYEGVKRAKGGGFQPADEVREDVWCVQSRSSQEARDFFYGGKVSDNQGDKTPMATPIDLSYLPPEATSADPRYANLKPADLARLKRMNDAAWEDRKRRLAQQGRLAAQPPRSAAEQQRDSGLDPATYARTMRDATPHTCGERPLEICAACLEANK